LSLKESLIKSTQDMKFLMKTRERGSSLNCQKVPHNKQTRKPLSLGVLVGKSQKKKNVRDGGNVFGTSLPKIPNYETLATQFGNKLNGTYISIQPYDVLNKIRVFLKTHVQPYHTITV